MVIERLGNFRGRSQQEPSSHYTTRELSGQKSELEGGCGDGKIYGIVGLGRECGCEREVGGWRGLAVAREKKSSDSGNFIKRVVALVALVAPLLKVGFTAI